MLFYAENGDAIERVSRWIQVRYRSNGTPFFIWHGRRESLDNYAAAGTPWTTGIPADYVSGSEHVHITGINATSAFTALFLELDDGGEHVRVYWAGAGVMPC